MTASNRIQLAVAAARAGDLAAFGRLVERRRAWSLDVLTDGQWLELLAWGEYADWVLRAIGADPAQQNALGAGVSLERIAALKYQIDDIRKIAATSLVDVSGA